MKFFNTIVLAGLSLTAVAQPTGIEANQLSENLQDRATPNTVGVLYTIVEQAYLSVHSDYNAISASSYPSFQHKPNQAKEYLSSILGALTIPRHRSSLEPILPQSFKISGRSSPKQPPRLVPQPRLLVPNLPLPISRTFWQPLAALKPYLLICSRVS